MNIPAQSKHLASPKKWLVALCGASLAIPALAQSIPEALVKAAKADGEVVFYSGATDNIVKRVGDAMQQRWGIGYRYTRMAGATNLQRYATEAEAGNFAADLVFNAGGSYAFALDAVKKGWVEPIADAMPGPVLAAFPKKFITGATATIQISPWGISWNTDKVSAADAPKDWPDILSPRFRNQILIADARSSEAILEGWVLLLDKYGEGFFEKLRAQNPRRYAGNVPAANGLAAGEGQILLPTSGQLVALIKEKGGPIADTTPSHTTGVEMQVFVTQRSKAKRPNAARLLAAFVMTPEGNKLFNADPGSVSVFDTTVLPKEYQGNKPGGVVSQRDRMAKLLGFE